MTCRIDPNKIEIDDRPEYIFYATHEFMIYQDGLNMVLGSFENNEVLSTLKLSFNYANHEFVDLDDAILYVFDHKEFVLMDKSGMNPISYPLDEHKLGRCLTKLFTSNDANRVAFGTKLHDRLQFVNFDFMEQKRVSQSSSWKMTRITDFHVDGTILYATLDDSFLVCCDLVTGETLWTRFETGKIGNGLIQYGDHLYYCCQGTLKRTNGQTAEAIRIPFIKPYSIVGQYGKYLYFTNKEGHTLCQYDLDEQTFTWEVFGSHTIKETVAVKGVDPGSLLMFLRTPNYVSVVDLNQGRAVSNIKTNKASRLRVTDDHILIHKHEGGTMLIPGLRDGDDD